MKFKSFFFVLPVLAGLLVTAQEGPIQPGSNTVSRPRKKASPADEPETELPKIPSKLAPKTKEEGSMAEGPSFKVDTNVVSVDVAVLDDKGHFIPGIPKGNFRVLEDNVPQQVTNFAMGEAPETVCLVVEFSNKFQSFYGSGWYQTLSAVYGFVETLKRDDFVAVMAYDLRPEILSDFTTDRRKTNEALQRLRIAAFSEANLYDALVEAEERMKDIEGRKAIVLISSGIDTFSKLTFDKTRKILQNDAVPIYAIGLLQTARELADARGGMGPIQRLDFLQADNQMKTFAKETGGQAFFPRFYGEFPSIYQSISQSLRNQYSIGYNPLNQARDGKYRKIKVDLVNPATNEPLRVVDAKGKPIKYQIIAKAGYTAPRTVE
ncbi:MAG: VWA domain-containing protein [Acidobacteriota bacterium]|nr:VWA domain-containing protein [Acidobacteriota bacterium]